MMLNCKLGVGLRADSEEMKAEACEDGVVGRRRKGAATKCGG